MKKVKRILKPHKSWVPPIKEVAGKEAEYEVVYRLPGTNYCFDDKDFVKKKGTNKKETK